MTQVALRGGFYQARSPIANQQRCENLYPEKNPEDSEAPYTMYQTPGLTALGAVPEVGTWRGLYYATNNVLYGVLNQSVYMIDNNWVKTKLGALALPANTPVRMDDNGITAIIVDGTNQGYTIDLGTNNFGNVNDPNFLGATHIGYLDTFLVFNQPNTKQFYSSLSNTATFDPTYVAAKTGLPDKLAGLVVMHDEIWLVGQQKSSEIWFNAGNPAFPFARSPGIFIEEGCVAPWSIAKHGLSVFWLGANKDGILSVIMGSNYRTTKISTPAIAAEFATYNVVSDAIGMVYKQQDHVFYVLTFPTMDKTWVFDVTESLWHQRTWTDNNGVGHRHRANCIVQAYGTIVAGDFSNGKLYKLDLTNYTDDGQPIVRRRSFPHLVTDGKRASYTAFRADIETGTNFQPAGSPWSLGFGLGFGPPAVFQSDNVYLRWSFDRGRSFGNPVPQTLGGTGNFLAQPQWRALGMGRSLLAEIFYAVPSACALQGAWVDLTPAAT